MTLFGCAICGKSGELFFHVCADCAAQILDAYQPPVDSAFEEWWAAYPHKVGKGQARLAYARARKKAAANVLLEGVGKYTRSKPPDIAYCNPATWLNGERWLDQSGSQVPMDSISKREAQVRAMVRGYVERKFWLPLWGPKPDERGADPEVQRVYLSMVSPRDVASDTPIG